MTSLLSVRGLRAGYAGIPVVFGVDLDVGDGEIVALLGANGAGKTTTLRAVSGMIRPMAGEVSFAGASITGRASDRIASAGVCHVPEGRGIFPSLRVGETLRLAAARAGARGRAATERIDEVYSIFPQLGDRREQAAGTLSGGEQQMLALARGLIMRPRLLLIDEMSQGLAPTVVSRLLDLVTTFPSRGVAVLLVEQFVGHALRIANRAYVLEKGVVRYAGGAAELAADESFVRSSYLGDTEVEAETVGRRRHLREERAAPEEALPSVLARALEEMAKREGVPVAELVRRALEESGGATPAAVARGERHER